MLDAAQPVDARNSNNLPSGSTEADARVPRKPLPAWIDIAALPSLEADGGSLGPTHLPAVLRVLRPSDPAIHQTSRDVSRRAPRNSRGRSSVFG